MEAGKKGLGPKTYTRVGPATLVRKEGAGYTYHMERKKMKPSSMVLALLATALLITPPASARKTKRQSAKAHSTVSAGTEAKMLVAEGLARMEDQDYDSAIRNFDRAVRAEGSSSAYFLLGYAHYQKGFRSGDPETADRVEAEETINAYAMAITLDPELRAVSEPYRLYHSMALSYEALKAYDKAIDSYKMAFSAAPLNPMLPLYAARLRFRMGDGPRSASNLALSLKKAKAAGKDKAMVSRLKNDVFFSVMMGSAENRRTLAEFQGLPVEASVGEAVAAQTPSSNELRDSISDTAAGSRASVALPQQNPAVLEALAAADEAYKFRRYRTAADQYNEVLDLDAKSAGLTQVQLSLLYERMGTAYNKLGLSNEAIRALQRSVQQMPNNSSAHYQIALAYSVSGKFSDSLKALSEAFRTAPSSGELKRVMLLAKTDAELEPVRDLPGFMNIVSEHSDRLARR